MKSLFIGGRFRNGLHLHVLRRCCNMYFEPRDGWVGYYLSEDNLYICFVPYVVIKIIRERY